ncbi:MULTISPECIES: ribonuclease H-like domain-containing protein [Bacillaceae]|uniref:Ribonuclease H-like domain-containing protein n=1 Tax=Evansella alkalicola TaxID=745819 RepID=A0ABS6JS77_9BACI|nr:MULTISPECIES: ribonuclease H-like domain-containing protein [Bacillaceae]MBU9721416.1 ribonuclease H-like domain-containing protein [Bacillus alkalicola]
MNLKSKLQRMKGHMNLEKENKDSVHVKQIQAEMKSQKEQIDVKQNKGIDLDESMSKTEHELDNDLIVKWKKLEFFPYHFEGQVAYQRRKLYAFSSTGLMNVRESLEEISQRWECSNITHPLSNKDVPLSRMLFFDTETTGLSTGAGNTIFLIGYARVLDNGIEVVQHLLGDPASEAAFMHGFLMDFREDDYLVSYNGKAFDWPQVKSRHAFVRNLVPRLPAFGHIDLLHAARRLWKHELPSCRLSIVEQEKLGIKRVNDTPGSMAPLLYYDYLHDKDPKHLEGIIEHNDQDVRSLIDLYIAISNRLFHKSNDEMTANEHIQIGRWFEQTGSLDLAKLHYEKGTMFDRNGSSEAFFRLGVLLKKLGNVMEAKDSFLSCMKMSAIPHVQSLIELAKIEEHHDKDVNRAYFYAKEAHAALKRGTRLTGPNQRTIADIEKRMIRLKQKI